MSEAQVSTGPHLFNSAWLFSLCPSAQESLPTPQTPAELEEVYVCEIHLWGNCEPGHDEADCLVSQCACHESLTSQV